MLQDIITRSRRIMTQAAHVCMQSGIENMGEQELIRKLQIAAQVCTYSLASTILKQPQQQFYQPPPPASSPRSAPSPASRSVDQGLMTADVTEKVPFKKGKWLGGKEAEGLVNKRQQRAVDDAPSISKEDRARGYKRMRAPSQVHDVPRIASWPDAVACQVGRCLEKRVPR